MTIKKNTLAYARDMDFRQFYILRREIKLDEEKEDNKSTTTSKYFRSWRVSLLGPLIDKNIHNFFHTNSLKFASDSIHDYKLLQIYITMSTTKINIVGNVIKANHTDYFNRNSEPNNQNNEYNYDQLNNSTETVDNNSTSTNTTNTTDQYSPYNYSIKKVALYSIEDIIDVNKFEDFNLDESIQKLKRYMILNINQIYEILINLSQNDHALMYRKI
jgi:hypothetical protein